MGMDAFAWAAVDTPLGALYVTTTEAGLAGVRLPGGRQPAALDAQPGGVLGEGVRQLREYFAGERTAFDLPIDWNRVSGLRRRVLEVLHETVRFGAVLSYGDLGARAGDPDSARAVGEIMATNPYAIVVPCHRVVASDGLGGYGGGLDMKRWLLAHEGVLQPMLF